MVGDFGLTVGTDVILHNAATIAGRDKHAAFAAAYFGGPDQPDRQRAQDIAQSSVPIIPTVGSAGDFGAHIPDFLQGTNGLRRRVDDPELTELSVAMLECLGLLRWQRRVFVSYRRIESRTAAMQLDPFAMLADKFTDTPR